MGPLSAKQHREYLKLEAEEQRKNAAFTQEQQRKEQLHKLKLQEAAAKASQGIAHKEQNQAVKLAEGTAKVPRINRQKLGLPSMNPLANTEVLSPGQKRLPGMVPSGTDTVPAMLTPGEAVIPAPAAQDPKNKKAIKRMVNEGRKANKENKGVLGFENGTTVVPSLAYAHYDEPGSSFMNGTNNVPAYADGTTEVPWLTRFGANPISAIGDALGTGFKTLVSAPGYGFNSELPKQETVQALPAKVVPVKIEEPPVVIPTTVPLNVSDTGGYNQSYDPVAAVMQREGGYVANDAGKGPTNYGINYTANKEMLKSFGINKPEDMSKLTPQQARNIYEQQYFKPFEDLKDNSRAYNAVTDAGVNMGVETARKLWEQSGGDVDKFTELRKQRYTEIANADKSKAKYLPGWLKRADETSGFKDSRIVSSMSNVDPNAIPQMTALAEPPVEGTGIKVGGDQVGFKEGDKGQLGLSPENLERFNTLGLSAQASMPEVDAAVQRATALPVPEQKPFLEKALSAIFGKEGLFSDKELIRFAVTAAGGILTGYDPARAIRWSARDALAAADKRLATEQQYAHEEKKLTEARKYEEAKLNKAAQAESAKNIRELIERRTTEFNTALGGRVDPTVRMRALEIFNQDSDEPARRAAIIDSATRYLRANTQPDTDKEAKPGKPEAYYLNGQRVLARGNVGNLEYLNPANGNWTRATAKDNLVSDSDYHAQSKRMKDAMVNRLKYPLSKAYGGDKSYSAQSHAEKLAEDFALLQNDLGPNVNPSDFAKMAENTITSAIELEKSSGKKLTEEGLRKAFYGNAVIDTRMNQNREFYVLKDKDGKVVMPSAEAQVQLGAKLKEMKDANKLDLGQASNALEKAWINLDPKEKQKFESAAKAIPGFTPFLFWVSRGAEDKFKF